MAMPWRCPAAASIADRRRRTFAARAVTGAYRRLRRNSGRGKWITISMIQRQKPGV
jgi:hypothetical protein